MRLRLATLIAAGILGIASTAAAQAEAPPAPPTETPTAPPATEAAPPPPADATAPAAAPADPNAPPAAPAEPAPPPPPVLPTSGDGAEVLRVLETVCVAGVAGGNTDAVAKANGFKKTKAGWVRMLGAKPYTVTIEPFSVANPTTCVMVLDYATGGAQAIIDGLNAWAYLHEPFMRLYRNDEYKTDIIRRTISWEHVGENGGSTGLVFVGEKKADGTPLSKVGDRATLRFQVRNGG